MITNVSLTTIYCTDQDATRDFYVDKLGFETRRRRLDRGLPLGHRRSPQPARVGDHPDEAGPPLDDEAAEFVRRQLAKGQMGGLGLRVDDCRKTHEDLVSKGVEFVQEPADRPYGVEAVMRDNAGNWLVLVEPKEFNPSGAG